METNLNDKLMEYLKLYGSHTIAFSAVFSEDLHQYYMPDTGFVIYGLYKNIRFILGDPLCPKDSTEKLIKGFIEETIAANNSLIAVQCGYETASVFSRLGYNANHMGVETILHLDTFDIKGKSRNKVRRWLNSAKNADVKVKEESMSDPEIQKQLENISEAWLQNKKNQSELTLLTRPLSFKQEPDIRLFCGYINNEIVGFITFEPMYENNHIIGYYANICRINNDTAPNGTLDLIMHEAREHFKEEGCKYFSFGLSPLSEIEDKYNMHNPIISFLLETNYKYGNQLYSFQGLDFHKKAYHDGISSERKPAFLVMRGTLPVNQIINTLSYIGILPNNNFVSNFTYLTESIIKGFYEHQKYKLTDKDARSVIDKLLEGLTYQEIASSLHLNILLIEDIAKSITDFGRKKLPEFQSNIYVQKNLDDTTKEIFAEIEKIIDEDKDTFLVYNIGIKNIEKSYYIMMTVELDGKKSIYKANFITARLKSKIKNSIPNTIGIFIETAPVGQYAHKIGLQGIKQTNFIL